MIVRSIHPLRAGVGTPVTIRGCGFNSECEIFIGENSVPVLDYTADSITFSAPMEAGDCTADVVVNDVVVASKDFVVVDLEQVNAYELPARAEDEFRDVLIGMMPRGFAWYTGHDGNFYKLLSAIGFALYYVYSMLVDLVRQMSPVKTGSLTTWENELGLPRDGLSHDNESDRISEIYRISRKRQGFTVPFYKSVCRLFGFEPQIYEYWKTPSAFSGIDFGSDDPNFYWMVDCGTEVGEVKYATCESTCEDYLSWWGITAMENLLNLIKPAHTKLLSRYTLPDTEE